MNEDIIRMAREAELLDDDQDEVSHPRFTEMLEHFANLVAAAERQVCDELCQDIDGGDNMFARAIRARSES